MHSTLKWFVLIACLSPSFAIADEMYTTTMPGTACKLVGPQATDTGLSALGEKANGLRNTSDTKAKVVCPITKVDATFAHSRNSFYTAGVVMSSNLGNATFYSRTYDNTDFDMISPWEIAALGNGMYGYSINGAKRDTSYRSVSLLVEIPAGAMLGAVQYNNYMMP